MYLYREYFKAKVYTIWVPDEAGSDAETEAARVKMKPQGFELWLSRILQIRPM